MGLYIPDYSNGKLLVQPIQELFFSIKSCVVVT